MPTLLVYLPNAVPPFQPTEAQLERLRARLPAAWTLLTAVAEPAFLAQLPAADAVIVWAFRQDWFALAPKLRAILTPAAGRDYFRITPPPGVVLRYGHFHGAIMAETVLAAILGFSRGLLPYAGLMRADGATGAPADPWPFLPFARHCRRLAGQTVLILGFGNIGQAVGRLLLPFGVRLIGVTRRAHPAPDWLGGAPHRVTDVSQLDAVLPEADFVVCVVPSDTGSDRLLDARRLARCKPTACLCNIGRGNLIDEAALADALHRHALAGAILDVFRTEPLPADSPLRSAPGVVLLPHASAFAPDYLDLYFDEALETLAELFA